MQTLFFPKRAYIHNGLYPRGPIIKGIYVSNLISLYLGGTKTERTHCWHFTVYEKNFFLSQS